MSILGTSSGLGSAHPEPSADDARARPHEGPGSIRCRALRRPRRPGRPVGEARRPVPSVVVVDITQPTTYIHKTETNFRDVESTPKVAAMPLDPVVERERSDDAGRVQPVVAGRGADALLACAHVGRWAEEVAAGRPYATVDDAAAAARRRRPVDGRRDRLGPGAPPRIGERAEGQAADASMSRSEQAGVDTSDGDVARRLVEGNRAYEERFGHVFLVRPPGAAPRRSSSSSPSGWATTPRPSGRTPPATCARSPRCG